MLAYTPPLLMCYAIYFNKINHRKDTVKSLLEEIVVREDRKSRDFATDLLGKYSYYLN